MTVHAPSHGAPPDPIDEGDAAATFNGEEGEALVKLTNWRVPDLVCRAARRNQCKVGVTP